jgi:hypothetical protein
MKSTPMIVAIAVMMKVRPNVDNIVPIIITRESTVTIPDRQTIPATDGSTVDNDDEDNDQQTTTVPLLTVPPVQKKTCQDCEY